MFAPLSRFWPTGDGWLRTHANYPWHRERMLRLLGVGAGADPDAVGRVLRDRAALDWEDRFSEVGALGFAVRTPTQWADHSQGRAAAAQPLARWSAPPAPRSAHRPRADPSDLPAAGLRVLDLTRVIAGPVATRMLAGWGADILRVDPPALPELPDQAVDTLSGKRSTLLDLTRRADLDALTDLLGAADLLVHGYRPGALDRFGLGGDDLRTRFPQLAVVGLSAWSPGGPWADRRGFDSLVQAVTGIADLEAGADGRPGALPAQALDHATGYLAAAAGLLALANVAAGDGALHVELALDRTARWLQSTSGVADPDPDHRDDPEGFLIDLPRPGTSSVRVIAPPGALGALRPRWTVAGRYGADPPVWQP